MKEGLWHGYSPVNFAEFLRTFFLTEHLCMTTSAAYVLIEYNLKTINLIKPISK